MAIEIFVAVVLGVIVGCVLVKDWREALQFLIILIITIFSVILAVVSLPIKIIYNAFFRGNPEIKIIKAYDKLFHVITNNKSTKRHRKVIANIEDVLRKHNIKKKNIEATKILNEAKWVI